VSHTFFRTNRIEIPCRPTTSESPMQSSSTFFIQNLFIENSESPKRNFTDDKLRLLASIVEQILPCLSTFPEVEEVYLSCNSSNRDQMANSNVKHLNSHTKQKFSFTLRLEVSTPISPSFRFSLEVIILLKTTAAVGFAVDTDRM